MHIKLSTKSLLCRDEAAAYILEPVEADSRRGLKRSWQGTPVDDREEGTSSGTKHKTPSKNKGQFNALTVSLNEWTFEDEATFHIDFQYIAQASPAPARSPRTPRTNKETSPPPRTSKETSPPPRASILG